MPNQTNLTLAITRLPKYQHTTTLPLPELTKIPAPSFEGGITTRIITHPTFPTRAFAYEVTFLLNHPRVLAVAAQKPPLHFHPYQEEYVQVIEGRLAVEIEGREYILTREDGEFRLPGWCNHRLYAPNNQGGEEDGDEGDKGGGEGDKKTVFILSGQDTDELLRLDTVFFENWYSYQDRVFVDGEKIDLIQVMSMFDAGGSYLSLPTWIPFSRTIARALGVVVGRWVGGILGYQPFYEEWTTDWELACEKMNMSVFQTRFTRRERERERRRKEVVSVV
ncbi:hypothetical protein GGS20DRAFT_582717 [Poronia punctata]|nr:hypothetical protein GGS20DRAFT_582717 [Poronia punctata]